MHGSSASSVLSCLALARSCSGFEIPTWGPPSHTALHSPSQPLTSSANAPPTSEHTHTHTHLLSFPHEQSASISRPLFETSQGWNMECLLPEYSFLSGLNRWHPVTRLWEGNLCEVKTHARDVISLDLWYVDSSSLTPWPQRQSCSVKHASREIVTWCPGTQGAHAGQVA
jgi:hypothetical protein